MIMQQNEDHQVNKENNDVTNNERSDEQLNNQEQNNRRGNNIESEARIHQVQVNENATGRWNIFNRNACRSLREGWTCYARENARRRYPRWISINQNWDGEEKKDGEAYASMEMDMALGNSTGIEAIDSNLW